MTVRLGTLEKATAELGALRTELLVKYAEAENVRKGREGARRAAEEEQSRKFALRISVVGEEMLGIAEKWKTESSPVSEGIVMTAGAMKNTLGKFELEAMVSEGKTEWKFKGETLK